ncbi:MAG: hypothetical protein OEM63_03585 [Gammaproteobacteria bacterium]|nr:hypothetical protein [Gammaproteobacteria bacterium]
MIVKNRLALLVIAPIAALSCALMAWSGELGLTANAPEVSIPTRPDGRNFMRLPELEYNIVADMLCPDGLARESLSLSIADTRVTRAIDAETGSRLELSVRVPAAQIGPVAVNQFCTAENVAAGGRRTLRIPSVLSAQAALLCVSETGREMTYASAPLDVMLLCESADQPQTEMTESQTGS